MDDTLYRCGVDSILRHCLTRDEVEVMLNDNLPQRGMWWSFIWAFYSPKNIKSGLFLTVDI